MGTKANVLYVCQRLKPYLEESFESSLCRTLPQLMQDKGMEIRTFMPKYGCINDRRCQLHEVIRLSGMNIVIEDADHQLIIKVASIPSARMQVYFIDNDDYFSRQEILCDQNGVFFADNDERAMFFARGVAETVTKLRWSPDIIHCNNWFSAIVPAYIRIVNNDNPVFKKSKIILSLFGDQFPGSLDAKFAAKLIQEGLSEKDTELLSDPTYENLLKFTLQYVDGLVIASKDQDLSIARYAEEKGIDVLVVENETDYADEYEKFYEKILKK